LKVHQVFNGDSSQSLNEIKITSNDVLNKIIKHDAKAVVNTAAKMSKTD